MTTRTELGSLGVPELEDLAERLGQPRYRGRQLHRWVYFSLEPIEGMSNLPAGFRDALTEATTLSRLNVTRQQVASDHTIKTLFELGSGRHIETVLIPDFEGDWNDADPGPATRITICVSSQVGCAMACSFCATGRMGFHQNLTAAEIHEQVLRMDVLARERFGKGVTNAVYMGMGEPLQNYKEVVRSVALLRDARGLELSSRKITVSTVGLARRIRMLAADAVEANLAISLHAPDDAKRSSIMPVNRAAQTDLNALREAVKEYAQTTGKPVTYEYCMFQGFNDGQDDARHLADVCGWAPSKVNLIMYNPVPGLGFDRTDESTLNTFIRTLVSRGVRVTVRRSRGQDIAAACGQLAADESWNAA